MFEDLKIVELASVLAGPMVGTFFSELGAEVLKIENKTTQGDVTRNWRLANEKKDKVSAYYAAANYNKHIVFLDLKNSLDYALALKEIKNADIVIANFKHGDAKKLKLDYETLRKENPNIIYGEITGYGKKEKRAAFDVVLQAETGFMYMNGNAESGPIKMPVALIDILAAHQLKEGLLCALIKKLKTNKASYVSVSLFDAAMSSLANQATNWLMTKHIPQAMGTKHPNIAPYGDMFLTKDKKHLVLAVGSDRQFQNLLKLLKLDDLLKEANFASNKNRVKNRANLNFHIEKIIKTQTAEYWDKLFKEKNIPAGIVKNMQEVFKNSAAQKLILKEKIEGSQTTKLKTVVFEIE